MTDRVMIDLETLGTEPGCAIAQVGAVRFGPDGLTEQFKSTISLSSCEDAGLTIDADTLEWWLDQDNATQVLTNGNDLRTVLMQLDHYLHGVDELWANSPSFDCAILADAYDAVNMSQPWEYWQERDYRTLKNLAVAPDTDSTAEHDALADAIQQAEIASTILRLLGGDD